MNRMIDWMARNGVAANLLMVFIIVAGFAATNTLVQEVFPEFSLDTVQVQVTYPGASPEEIEESIVRRIEDRIESVEGIDRITATASENVGTVSAELTRTADQSEVRDDIKQEVDRIVSFPEGAEEPVVSAPTNRQQAIQLAVYGNVSERALKEAAQRMKDELTANTSTSYIQVGGVRNYEISIEVSREALRAYGLSLPQISQLVSSSSLDLPAGEIETDEEQITVRTEGENFVRQDFEEIVLISQNDGTKVRLGDVASVEDGFEDSELITRFNGQPAAMLQVYRTGDEQVLRIVEEVRNHLDQEIRPSLPHGIQVDVWQNNADNLRSRLNLLIENGIYGLLLVILALGLFLHPRLAFWTSVGMFISFIGAFAVMIALDISINLISLFGFILSIGIVVDDAIVVGENVFAEQETGKPPLQAAIDGTQRVGVPVTFAILTTVAAFSPLLFVGGMVGKFLGDIPAIVITVLLLSLVEVLLILPHHLSQTPHNPEQPKNRFLRGWKMVRLWVARTLRRFIGGPLERTLQYATRHYGVVISGGIATLLVIGGLVAGGYVRFSFFPDVQGEVVSANVEMPVGTAVGRTAEVARILEESGREAAQDLVADLSSEHPDLLKHGYTTIGRQQGGGPGGGGGAGSQASVATVTYELIDPGRREISTRQFENAWREATGELTRPRSLTFASSAFGATQPVSVELSGENTEQLDAAVSAVEDSLRQFTGVFDVANDQQKGVREVQLELKPAARTLGLTLQDLAGQVRAAFFGDESYRLQRGEDEVRVYTRLPEDQRDALADIDAYRIRTAGGAAIPLEEVATTSLGTGPSQINHRAGRRVVTVTADVNDQVVTAQEVVGSLGATVLPNLQEVYPQIDYSFQGEQRQQREAMGSLMIGFPIALFVIYLLLAIPFRSYVQPIIIMSTIPFGWTGAILGHMIFGLPLGLLSIFGLVGLTGVIVNDALIMIDFANEAHAKGMDWSESLVEAGKARFRPILLTSLTTFLGVFPIIIETSFQAQFLIPMAVSLGFGILFGTVVLMLMVPSLGMLQRDLTVGIQKHLLGRSEEEIQVAAGPYGQEAH